MRWIALVLVSGAAQASAPTPLELQEAARLTPSARSFETLAAAEPEPRRAPEPAREAGALAVPESIALSLAGLGVAGLLSRRWQLQAGA